MSGSSGASGESVTSSGKRVSGCDVRMMLVRAVVNDDEGMGSDDETWQWRIRRCHRLPNGAHS